MLNKNKNVPIRKHGTPELPIRAPAEPGGRTNSPIHERLHRQPDVLPALELDELIDLVRRKAVIDIFRAEALITAILQALSEVAGPDSLTQVTAQLPKELSVATRAATAPHAMPLGDFLNRVCALAIVESDGVHDDVCAVLATLNEAIEGDHLADVLTRLPREYRSLLAPTSLDHVVPDVRGA